MSSDIRLRGDEGAFELAELNTKYSNLLIQGEEISAGFQVIRDAFMLTNKRLILVDLQDMTGRKREYISIPYPQVTKFSVETVGSFELDSQLKIWHRNSAGPILKRFHHNVNIHEIQSLLSQYIVTE